MATDDKIMVAETIYLYATGIDTKDFNLYRSIFADQVEIDFSSYEGSSVPEPDFLTGDQWVNRQASVHRACCDTAFHDQPDSDLRWRLCFVQNVYASSPCF